MDADDFGFALFVVIATLFLAVTAGLCMAAINLPRMDEGRCMGLAEASGQVAAWDADGRCVLGQYPAQDE